MGAEHIYEGGCLCGKIRYRDSGVPIGTAHCHCDKCRRYPGAVFASGVGFSADNIEWLNEEPALYQSSENCARLFCPACGSSIAHHWLDIRTTWPFIGTLDHPESVTPELHIFVEEQIPWLRINDGLPRYSKFPPARRGDPGC
jgi:hypothetical protein